MGVGAGEGMMEEPEDRTLAEDYSIPVRIEPGVDYATPPGWEWRRIGTSRPNRAPVHISHTDVSRVMVDVLRPSDSPPEAYFVVSKEIPIVILDSIDKYWAGESRSQLRLEGLRVPVEHETVEGAKQALATDLAAQLRLLLLLSQSGGGNLAPQLKSNLTQLRKYLAARPVPNKEQS